MDDDVHTHERRPQRVGIPDVTLPVRHLRPAALRRVERPAGDPDDVIDPVVVLEQGHQPRAEGAGGSGDRDGQAGRAHRLAAAGFSRGVGAGCSTSGAPCWARANSSSSSIPRRMPRDRTSTSAKASKSALIPKVIVFW